MEEKILFALAEMNQRFEKRFDVMDQKIDRLREDLSQELEKKLEQKLEKKLEQKLEQKLDEKLEQKLSQFKKEILDQLFIFEQEYGAKIDAILDSVSMEMDKNIEKSEKIRNLGKRMDRAEVTIFNHEKRISSIEMKS